MNRSTQFIAVAAALVSAFAFTSGRSHAGHTVLASAPPASWPATAGVTVPETAPIAFTVSEQTITARAPIARHAAVETDAQHIARLMSAPVEMVSCAGCTARKANETFSGRVSRLSPDNYAGRNAPTLPVYGSDNVIRAAALPYAY